MNTGISAAFYYKLDISYWIAKLINLFSTDLALHITRSVQEFSTPRENIGKTVVKIVLSYVYRAEPIHVHQICINNRMAFSVLKYNQRFDKKSVMKSFVSMKLFSRCFIELHFQFIHKYS